MKSSASCEAVEILLYFYDYLTTHFKAETSLTSDYLGVPVFLKFPMTENSQYFVLYMQLRRLIAALFNKCNNLIINMRSV